MAKPATGQVVVRNRARGRVYGLRFRAYGERQYLTLPDGTTPEEAATELVNVLADVRRGIWKPPAAEVAPEPTADPTFHEFASEWWAGKRGEVDPNTQVDYEWQLSSHLLPFFKDHRLSQITVEEVDRYRRAKVAESARRAEALEVWHRRMDKETDKAKRRLLRRQRPPKGLSATSINKTLTRLGQILDQADEYGMIPRNPLRVNPRNRKLKAAKPSPVWLDRADQIEALLDAAGDLDGAARPDRRHIARQAMLAMLVFTAFRLDELLSLRWRDVDIPAGRLFVPDSKTAAGVRFVELLPALRDILLTYKAGCPTAKLGDLVFPTSTGRKHGQDNFRERVFERAVTVADERRAAAGLSPLPRGLTPHKLRHTCCALLFACGWELPRVMSFMGHADVSTTLRIYAHVMATDGPERKRLRALVEGADWAPMGTTDVSGLSSASDDRMRA